MGGAAWCERSFSGAVWAPDVVILERKQVTELRRLFIARCLERNHAGEARPSFERASKGLSRLEKMLLASPSVPRSPRAPSRRELPLAAVALAALAKPLPGNQKVYPAKEREDMRRHTHLFYISNYIYYCIIRFI